MDSFYQIIQFHHGSETDSETGSETDLETGYYLERKWSSLKCLFKKWHHKIQTTNDGPIHRLNYQ